MFDLREYEIDVETVHRNMSPAALYQKAFLYDQGATLSDTGALIAYSGDKTGRSPKDKRVVKHPESSDPTAFPTKRSCLAATAPSNAPGIFPKTYQWILICNGCSGYK